MKESACECISERYLEPCDYLDSHWVEGAIEEVLHKIDNMIPRFGSTFPSASAVNGRYQPVEKVDWTEGFWVGMLWLAWEVTHEVRYRQTAEAFLPQFRTRLEKKIKTNTHDLGFLYSLSCKAAYQLTGNKEAYSSALWAADLLYERFNRKAGIIQAWGDLNDPQKQGRMIIDCNLNLPLLFWASEVSGCTHYAEAAQTHLERAKRYLVRDDASTYHTFNFDINTGAALSGTTHQGWKDDSCWARGQAWAMTGFALDYGYDRDPELLELSKKTSIYYLNRLPADYISYWDLIFTESDHQYRDTSAASCAVCGLLEQMKWLSEKDSVRPAYQNAVSRIMTSLRDSYFAHDDKDGLLLHGVYNYPRKMGIDTQNLWGDYFYFEALVRMYINWIPYW